ncbi:MAG TPA: hypothetical protein VMM38_08980 [Aridibacter sp.]|nr:hypothetical protein [Aridibacter sp.]
MNTLKLNSSFAYRIAAAVAILSSLMLVWISLGVGIIGADGDTANMWYFGVIAVGVVGALIARFRARGMAFTMFAMALGQAVIGIYAIAAGLGLPYSPPLEILGLTGFFVVLFAASGWLFLRAAGEE